MAEPYNVSIDLTVNKGSLNDMLHFKSTFNQSERKLKKGSIAIFDKGANSKENLDLIEECGHDYFTAMKHNKSLDKGYKQIHPSQYGLDGQQGLLILKRVLMREGAG